MKKAIFLDRDGVINREIGDYTYKQEDFAFNEGLFEALNILQKNDYLLIVITNQGGIAKGIYSHQDFKLLTQSMIETLSENNIDITDVYYCPHHSDIEKCLCRKPNTLMLEKAIAKYKIDIKKSYFIGDSKRDIEAGDKLGLNTIKIKANENLLNILDDIK
jgi:D-glycero-D-manno-heptose 1,7-bisphosphate phosphatase